MLPRSPSRLFALIIGINQYQNEPRKLKGAVADAEAMVDFLKTALRVADNRIKNLRDQQATRSNICQSIRDLGKCEDIQQGDPILIYYAGHGAEVDPPEGWPSGGDKIQMLLPYNFRARTSTSEDEQGILDITLCILLKDLALAKGNNIVSCVITFLI